MYINRMKQTVEMMEIVKEKRAESAAVGTEIATLESELKKVMDKIHEFEKRGVSHEHNLEKEERVEKLKDENVKRTQYMHYLRTERDAMMDEMASAMNDEED